MISVIMSTYNETEKDLRDAIDSVLMQTYQDFEFIIICDNPNNQKHQIILEEYAQKDCRVKYFFNEKNMGLALSLNRGLSLSSGEYIARMDADDISFPNRFELQMAYLQEHPDCDVVSSNRIDIDENTNLIGTETLYAIKDEALEKIMRYGSIVNHPSVIMRKSVIDKLGGYRNFRAAQDYDLWLRVLSAGYKIHIMEEQLLRYRIRKDGISKVNFARQYFYTKYAVYLYEQRKKNQGVDDYSEENTLKYLEKCGLNDKQYVDKLNTLYGDFISFKNTKQYGKLVVTGFRFLGCPEMFKIVLRGIKFKKSLSDKENRLG